MVSQVAERHTLKIDGKVYRVNGRVQRAPLSQQPGKVTIGDFADFSNPMVSEFSLGDFRDGIGVDRGDVQEHLRNVWWATGQLRYRDAFVPGRRVVTTAVGPSAGVDQMVIYNDEVYATYGTAVHLYDNSGDDWGASIRTLAGTATDIAVGLVGGTLTLVIPNGTDVDYATGDPASWAENTTQAIKYVVFWNDLLWGITDAGQLYFTDDLSAAWTADALLQMPSGSVVGLGVARGPDREQHIYAVTKEGVQVHDAPNARFVKTDLDLPFHPDGGKGYTKWRGSQYYSAGSSVYLFQAGTNETIIDPMGPGDRHDGMPQSYRGVVNHLLPSHNELMAFLDASSVEGASQLTTRVSSGFRHHHNITFKGGAGFSTILGWNERGWETKWISGSVSRAITAGVIGNAYSTYRLWWAANRRIYYMALPTAPVNPLQITTQEYESESTLETPWFDMGIRNQQKLALSVIVETINDSADETVEVEFARNYDETYTRICTQDTTGEVEYRLPDNDDITGTPFRAWKYRVTLNRGSTVTNKAQLVRLTLVYRPRIETIWAVRASLDLTEPFNGREPIVQEADLDKALNSGRLVEVSYRDDYNEEHTYLMDFLDLSLSEQAGPEMTGTVNVTLGEPISTREGFLHERG